MEKLRTFLRQAFSYPMELKKTHPVTAVSVIVSTVLFAIYSVISVKSYNFSSSKETALEYYFCVCLSCCFFAVFALCLESIRPKWSAAVGYAVYAGFGVLSLIMGFIESDLTEAGHRAPIHILSRIRTHFGDATIILYIVGLLAVALLLAVYFSYNRSIKRPFNSHVIDAGARIFFSSIIYGVIQLGVLFLTIIVEVLLYDDAFEYLGCILILINGLFFIPSVLCALTRENEPANMFIQILVRYVMLIISLIAFIIIYIYMIKLVVTASVPSNSVYAILTSLFIVSMFISYMSTAYESKGLLQKFAYNSPLIFAPFILMQCYTVFVRIGQYGLTPKRYFGIAFIAFELVYIIYYVVTLKRDHEVIGSNVLLIICSIAIIVLFIPGVNARSLSRTLCRATLSSYLDKAAASEQISDKELLRANAAYGFLTDKSFGNGQIRDVFDNLDAVSVADLKDKAREAADRMSGLDKTERDTIQNGWNHSDIQKIAGGQFVDIGDFSRLAYVNIEDTSDYDPEGPKACDATSLAVSSYDANPLAGCEFMDLKEYCTSFINLSDEYRTGFIDRDRYDEECSKLAVIDTENARLYITDADISYNRDKQPVDIRLEGYLLIR